MFSTPYFQITVVSDTIGVELCGALKNIVAFTVGICQGLNYGFSTKAAVIHIGMLEIMKFARMFYKDTDTSTFQESCGVADMIATCFGGRGQEMVEAMVHTGKSVDVLEDETLGGQKLQGKECVKDLYDFLKEKNAEKEFPMFIAVYQICFEGLPFQQFIDKL